MSNDLGGLANSATPKALGHQADNLREAIEKSIGMRERDQHDALIDFGDGKITKETLKALSDESRVLFVKDLLRIFQTARNELLVELLGEQSPTERTR
jgi:hypothetical protein